ncbi:MmgE/PrpD family protein [Niveispirillum sp.]|uniref:MmgE/PrpD family protein n=1 Tax=Niveispirillum sp. TaxID=1917217 RepID=UPI001B7C20EE|nr:MmgE/PrpD family protein [Niveispirillum sp.]MBP7336546.1 MmgE/PrpD family protein [Niveispirillum sp.]
MTETAAEILAHHYVTLKPADIPAGVIADCKTLVRDYLGVALGGSRTGSGKAAAGFALEVGGRQEATIIGHGGRVPAVHAALANAIASHSIELDDVDILALFHFSPPVVSAALAAAEREGASGEAFIAAVAAGCDMMARASDATNFSLRDRGYHTTPTCGVFGATVAAGRLMGLDRDQMVSALGLAGAQASGLMEMYGPSMQKRFNPGPAARNGVTAAQMAKLGFTGTATIFEGERGFCRAFSDKHDIAALTRGLGSEWPVHIEYKAYSCARPIHNAIDCALAVRAQLAEPVSSVRRMVMRRHPAWAHYHLNTRPQTYHEAQVSLPYSVAVALIEGAALFPQYQNEKLGDPDIRRLSDLLEIVPDETLPRGVSCHLTVETDGGARLESQVDHPKGSIANPMTNAEMNAKVHLLADPVLGAERVGEMIAAVDAVERLETIGRLTRLTVPAA